MQHWHQHIQMIMQCCENMWKFILRTILHDLTAQPPWTQQISHWRSTRTLKTLTFFEALNQTIFATRNSRLNEMLNFYEMTKHINHFIRIEQRKQWEFRSLTQTTQFEHQAIQHWLLILQAWSWRNLQRHKTMTHWSVKELISKHFIQWVTQRWSMQLYWTQNHLIKNFIF